MIGAFFMQLEERLLSSKDFFEVGDFDCGIENEPLSEYIKDSAFIENETGKTKTYVIWAINKETNSKTIVGYYSLRCNSIGYVESEKKGCCIIPTVELSEFAIDYRYQGSGIGTNLFFGAIIPKVQRIMEQIGCQAILVYAFHERAIAFYERLGFREVDIDAQYLAIPDNFSTGCKVFLYTLIDE